MDEQDLKKADDRIDLLFEQKEEKLQDEDYHYYLKLADFNDNGIIIYNEEIIVYVNEIAIELLGAKSHQELTGKPIYSLFPGKDREILHTDFIGTKHMGRLIRCDGTEMNVDMMVMPLAQSMKFALQLVFRDTSGQIQPAKTLINASNEWRSTFDAMHDPVCLLNNSFEVLRCNKPMVKFFGKPFSKIVGQKCYDIMHCNWRGTESCPFQRMKQSHMRETLTFKAGRKWLCVSLDPLIEQENGTVGAVFVITDITNHKQHEEQLTYINKTFLSLGPDYDININMLTKTCGELLGATYAIYNRVENDQLVSVGKFRLPEDYRQSQNAEGWLCHDVIKKYKKNEICIIHDLAKTEYYRTDPNVAHHDLCVYAGHPVFRYGESIGSLCAVFKKNVEIDEKNQNIMGIVAAAIGIEEERRWFEEQLVQQNDFMNNIISSLTYPFYVIDVSNHDIKMVNAAASSHNLVDKAKCYELIYKQPGPCNAKEYPCPIEKVMKFKKSIVLEHIHSKANGEKKFFEVHGYPIVNNKGEVVQIIVYAIDITARRNIEDELQKVQKLESLGILAGGIAHDFNNILTSILGNIEILRLHSDPATEHYERYEKVEKALGHAKSLTQQLLTFSKGGVPVKRLILIDSLLIEASTFALRGSNSRINYSIPDNLWTIEADEGQISQVINNLVINADQAMPKGGIIDISAENSQLTEDIGFPVRPGDYIKITIKDHGVGIADEILPKIFDPFFTTKEKGSGLGLATSFSIIKKHGGYMKITSKPNDGTDVYIYLPANKDMRPDENEPEDHIVTGKGKVLLLDDEEGVRDIAAQMLNHCGYEVVQAKDGAEAVTIFRMAYSKGLSFDVVIADLTIPGGMSGKDALKEMLKINPSIKAVVSSGYSNDPIMANYQEHGFKGVLTKPYRLKDLSILLARMMTM